MSTVAVREARIEDAAAIARISVAAWRSVYAGIVDDAVLAGLDSERRAAAWRTWIAQGGPDGRTLVAERDGVVLGFVNYGRSDDADVEAGIGQVRAIYVDPAVRGTGAGAALMNRALAGLARAGYREAVLWVFASNHLGRRFYSKGGWEPDGATKEEENGASPPLAEIRLRRGLDGRGVRTPTSTD